MEEDKTWRNLAGTFASIWTILQMLSPLPLCHLNPRPVLINSNYSNEIVRTKFVEELFDKVFKFVGDERKKMATVLQMPTCYHFMKTKSVGDMIVTPYVVALMSCSLWLFYGLIIQDATVIRVNLIGAGLQLCYSLCYYVYCQKKEQVRKQMAVGVCVVWVAITYAHFETDFKKLVSYLGFYCSCVTVAFFASPLANMRYVIKVWNSESLPRLLIAATFIVSVQWSLYGYIINDRYILVTNILGTILSAVQLTMVLVIPRESKPKVVSTI